MHELRDLRLSYSRNYCAVFTTRTSLAKLVDDLPEPLSCDLHLYEAVGASLLVLRGSTHVESVGATLAHLHHQCLGQSFIAGELFGVPPEATAVCRLEISLQSLPSSVLVALRSRDDVFALHCIPNGSIWILCASTSEIPVRLRAVDTAYFAFSRARHKESDQVLKTRPAYDPIKSRISELANQLMPTYSEQLHVLERTLPAELRGSESKILNPGFDEIRQHLAAIHNADDGELVEAVLDHHIPRVSAAIHQAQSIINGIADYDIRVTESGGDIIYSTATGGTLLRSVERLSSDILRRLGQAGRARIWPLYGDDWVVEWPAPMLAQAIGEDVRLLFVPRSQRLRLGAIPLAAHLVWHAVSPLTGGITDDFLGILVDADLSEFGISKPSKPKSELLAERVAEAEEWEAFRRTSSEIVADLVACATCGPAYVFALARFGGRIMGSARGFPSLGVRIQICLTALNRWDIDTPFTSEMLAKRPLSHSLNEAIDRVAESIPGRYTSTEHSEAVGSVKQALEQGEVTGAHPVLVMNALWDGVARRSGYVHEVAALVSIVGSGPTP